MRGSGPGVQASIGYAVGRQGRGLAYAHLTGRGVRQVLRLPLRIGAGFPQTERASAYAALTAVARALRERGFSRARFVVDDAQFVDEVTNGRQVAEQLVLPYVRLRCALNSLSSFSVRRGATDDLTQRARAEVALNLAA
jgi:hypothetical protein